MVDIISSNTDHTTSDIIEWLYSQKKPYRRFNNLLGYDGELVAVMDNENPKQKDNSIYFRKREHFEYVQSKEIKEFYEAETQRLINFLFSEGNYKKVIGRNFKEELNKLEILQTIQHYGIKIPRTIITNSKNELCRFLKKNKKIITKPLSECININVDGKLMGTYTKIVDTTFLINLPTQFHSSLFQQYIDKEFEIRIFYLNGKVYPMAIFSQDDKKTKVDFRNYNYDDPNRTVPYKLPYDLEQKLLRFMAEEKFEAASVDMVKCKITGEFYFLEVNPWGQFGMVSNPCNYYLEKKIAELL